MATLQPGHIRLYPIVSTDPEAQARYEAESFVKRAFREASRRRRLVLVPFRDDETLSSRGFSLDESLEVSDDFEAQVRYWIMRLDGESHRMAEMLATRSFPGVRTDATFNSGRCNGNQFEATPSLGDHHRRLAEAAGVSTTGKFYSAGLADFPGDPTAWVSDRHDVLRVAAAKGYKVTGDVEYDPGEREPMPDVAIAPEIVEAQVDEYMAKDPGERRDDVKERVTAFLTGAVDPNPPLVEE